ncbi:MAG TPA: SdpI family protein [Hanamia sp.]|nr:SdpI family protein [Hanamia sp.]
MKPKLPIAELLVLLVVALPFLYLLKVYPTLPPKVPTHFGINGQPNAYSNRSFLWVTTSILAGISIFVYLLIRFLPRIDPKKKAKYSATVFNKIAVAIVLLMSLIGCYSIYAAKAGSFQLRGFLPVILGIFFAFMGNLMHSIKPNYFVGIRTPWTLENEETWRKTHQLGGKLWFVGGILIAITGFLVPARAEVFVMMSILIVIVLWPVIFSYTYFKSLERIAG